MSRVSHRALSRWLFIFGVWITSVTAVTAASGPSTEGISRPFNVMWLAILLIAVAVFLAIFQISQMNAQLELPKPPPPPSPAAPGPMAAVPPEEPGRPVRVKNLSVQVAEADFEQRHLAARSAEPPAAAPFWERF